MLDHIFMIRTNASACFPARISGSDTYEAAREHIELIRYILNDQRRGGIRGYYPAPHQI